MKPNTYHLAFNRQYRELELCKNTYNVEYVALDINNVKHFTHKLPSIVQIQIRNRFDEDESLVLHMYNVVYYNNKGWSNIGYIIFKDNLKYDSFRIINPYFFTPKDNSVMEFIKEVIINKQNP